MIVPKTYAYTFTIMEKYAFCIHFFVFLERRPSTVYGVYQSPTELLGTSKAFTGD